MSLEILNLSKEIYRVNLLNPYPLSDLQVVEWAKCINLLLPEMKPEMLQLIINKMMLGVIEWDGKKGIQNIFSAYKKLINERIVELISLGNNDIEKNRLTEIAKRFVIKNNNRFDGLL